jgi:hypothetical protein
VFWLGSLLEAVYQPDSSLGIEQLKLQAWTWLNGHGLQILKILNTQYMSAS